MDNEMREAVRDLREQVVTGQTRLETKLEDLTAATAAHTVESAVHRARIEESTKSAHYRLDAHMRGHWWVMGIIGGIITAVGAALLIAIIKLLAKA